MSDSMIEQSVERVFSNNVDKALLLKVEAGEFPSALWQLVCDSGFAVAVASEQSGGIGQTWGAAYPILRGLGYWQLPVPLAETMVATSMLSAAGIDIPDGPIAIIEANQDGALSASGAGATTRLSGRALRVPWARHCPTAIVSLPDSSLALIDLNQAASVRRTAVSNHARLPSDNVQFDSATVLARAPNGLPGLDRPVLTLGAMTRSAMMVGALEWLLGQGVQYANDRVQFGKPIGKNQAIQQQLSLMAGDVAAARVAATVAANDAASPAAPDFLRTSFSTAVAKSRVGEAATRGAAIVHQVHGAIGFTQEHMLHFATRRLWTWREEFGADAWWAERLGRAAIQARSAAFWPALTDRHFKGDLP
jgi:acyl-CoA dehydrogenase